LKIVGQLSDVVDSCQRPVIKNLFIDIAICVINILESLRSECAKYEHYLFIYSYVRTYKCIFYVCVAINNMSGQERTGQDSQIY